MLWKTKPLLTIPSEGLWIGAGAHVPSDGLWLGTLSETVTGKEPPVWLSTAKEQVLAIVGKRGSGKSFTLGVIAEGLALATPTRRMARQSRRRAALLFDPLDVYWTTRHPVGQSSNEEAQRHYEMAESVSLIGGKFDVEAWVPGAASGRPTDPSWFRTLELPVSSLGHNEWELLLGVNILRDPIGQALADALQLTGRQGFRRRGNVVPAIPDYDLENLRESTLSDELVPVYHAETLRALRQRLGSLQQTGLFSAHGATIGTLIAPGRLTVILLGRLGFSYRAAVVAVLTKLLIEDRTRAAFAEKRLALDPSMTGEERIAAEQSVRDSAPRTVVILDEAQSFLAPDVPDTARNVYVRLVKEGRNIGLSAVLATQQPSAIDQRILSQVETFIAHQLVTESDIRAVRENLKSSVPDGIEFGKQQVDLSGLLRALLPGQCLVSSADMNTTTRRAFIMTVRPRATIHGGIEL
jgi:hypothetical protein